MEPSMILDPVPLWTTFYRLSDRITFVPCPNGEVSTPREGLTTPILTPAALFHLLDFAWNRFLPTEGVALNSR